MKVTIILEDDARVEISREFQSLNEQQFLEIATIVWKNAHPIIEGLAQERHLVITRVPMGLRIQAIKIIRNHSGLSLVDAKEFIESGPCSGIPKVFTVSANRWDQNLTRENCASELMRAGISCGFYTNDEIATLEIMTS